ncbi:YckD family protein [Caldanaerobacter subterraneus KAk]|uniref:YckD family protein n=1 Tax=Caldanaerobacter subterraneus TaxID=911092 RepID=UPI0032C1C380
MKKNKWLIALAVILALAIPLTVFAANPEAGAKIKSFFGIDTSKLTPQQKQMISDYNKKIADLEKEFVNKLVDAGLITRQQADNIIKNIDERVSKANENNVPFFMGGKGFDRGFFGIGRIDTSKFTDEQKKALEDIYKQMAELQKNLVNKLVSEGVLTQDQANKIINAIDNAVANADKNLYAMFGGKDGLGFILRGIDPSKLTEQQKNELINYFKQMAQLQKQLVDKLVSFGTITQDQGNTIKNRIDEMVKNIEQNGLPQKFFRHFEWKKEFKKEWFKGNAGSPVIPQGNGNSI